MTTGEQAARNKRLITWGGPPLDDAELAMVATLPAGRAAYTAIVRGVNNTTGSFGGNSRTALLRLRFFGQIRTRELRISARFCKVVIFDKSQERAESRKVALAA
jgi:hypothetical protein